MSASAAARAARAATRAAARPTATPAVPATTVAAKRATPAAPRVKPAAARALATSAPTGAGKMAGSAPTSFYDFTVKDIHGKDVALKDYTGKVVVVVNVASKCGYTKQYAGLQKLWQDFKDKGAPPMTDNAVRRVARPSLTAALSQSSPVAGFLQMW